MPQFSEKSLAKLQTCHPALQQIMQAVIQYYDCTILCGHRGKKEQEDAYIRKVSKALWGQSPHNTKPSKAVDVVPYPLDWNNIEDFFYMAGIVKGIASQLGIKVKWGGEFKKFLDGPHFELEDK